MLPEQTEPKRREEGACIAHSSSQFSGSAQGSISSLRCPSGHCPTVVISPSSSCKGATGPTLADSVLLWEFLGKLCGSSHCIRPGFFSQGLEGLSSGHSQRRTKGSERRLENKRSMPVSAACADSIGIDAGIQEVTVCLEVSLACSLFLFPDEQSCFLCSQQK